jgi:hypothetical protein
VGAEYTMTTMVDANGAPLAGVTVTFNITAGPNAPLSGTALTDGLGNATFSYTSSVDGTDTWQASVPGSPTPPPTIVLSNSVSVTWIGATSPSPSSPPPSPPIVIGPHLTG